MKPNKRKLLIALGIGGAVSAIALAVYLLTLTTNDIMLVAPDFASFLCCVAIALVAVVPFAGIAAMILGFLNWQAVRTVSRLAAHRLSARIAAKNAGTIYPCVQQFLYFVLNQNREFLRLPLGKGASCLVPGGYGPAYRSGCVFYRFQLISPERPEMEIPLLRQIIQSYVVAELNNYGIEGLPSVFQSQTVGTMPSVFLDRLYYDEGGRFIGFDVLYIDNEDAAVYARNSIIRATASVQPEVEVTDGDF